MDLKERLARLVDVKSIITFAFAFLVIGLSAFGKIEGNEILEIFELMVVFYFGTQTGKKEVVENATNKPIVVDNKSNGAEK